MVIPHVFEIHRHYTRGYHTRFCAKLFDVRFFGHMRTASQAQIGFVDELIGGRTGADLFEDCPPEDSGIGVPRLHTEHFTHISTEIGLRQDGPSSRSGPLFACQEHTPQVQAREVHACTLHFPPPRWGRCLQNSTGQVQLWELIALLHIELGALHHIVHDEYYALVCLRA